MIRIAYFGLPLGALLLAADGLPPCAIVLSPPDAPGRRRLARTFGGPLLDARDYDDADELDCDVWDVLSKEPPELVVSWYWTRRLSARVLGLPRLGAIGVHPSLLPRHRGPNPFFAAIDAADRVTGVTVHRLVEAYDEGDVLAQRELTIADRNAWQLARALDRPSLAELRRVVRLFADGTPPPSVPQDGARATLAPEPTGDLLKVDWTWPVSRVLRRIRALSPVPGLAIEIRGESLFVVAARAATWFPAALAPGEAARTAEGVVIRAGGGAIVVERAILAEAADADDEDPRPLVGDALGARLGLDVTSAEGAWRR